MISPEIIRQNLHECRARFTSPKSDGQRVINQLLKGSRLVFVFLSLPQPKQPIHLFSHFNILDQKVSYWMRHLAFCLTCADVSLRSAKRFLWLQMFFSSPLAKTSQTKTHLSPRIFLVLDWALKKTSHKLLIVLYH